MRIGAHVSVGKGWVRALDYCREVGAECLQVFSKSPRTWRAAALPDEVAQEFPRAMREEGVGPLYVHTSYLINLGSDDEALWQRSIDALAEELRRAGVAQAEGLVTHVGTDPWGDRDRAASRIAEGIAQARGRTDDAGRRVVLLLENSAGTGRQYGAELGELTILAERVVGLDSGPVGVCFDTCHAFAYGYSLDDGSDWESARELLTPPGGDCLVRLIHANDCAFGRGERKDRHAWIGEGEIGPDCFSAMFDTLGLEEVDVIIEMPGDIPEKDDINIATLKTLREAASAVPPG